MIKHLAMIMDGNRRWAKQKGLTPSFGHYYGAQAAQKVVDFCLEQNISYLSLYAFSLENFKRTQEERDYLFNLLVQETEKNLDIYLQKQIRIKFIGDRSLFPEIVIPTCNNVEEKTKDFKKLQLNLLFCYGARQEIISAVKNVVDKVNSGEINKNNINEDLFSELLWTNGTPEPDLIIRTGGQQRLSNFLLYQSAYSEIYFLDCLWPDINSQQIQNVINKFNECKRNFGV